MTEPIDTSKRASDMSEAEKQAFLQQCRKHESAPPPPVDTRNAKDMTEQEREEWWREHLRRWR